jgi:hypothetical protein
LEIHDGYPGIGVGDGVGLGLGVGDGDGVGMAKFNWHEFWLLLSSRHVPEASGIGAVGDSPGNIQIYPVGHFRLWMPPHVISAAAGLLSGAFGATGLALS